MPTEPFVRPASRRWLLVTAGLSGAIAVLHLGIIFAGPGAYAFFGAPELATLEVQGSLVPDAITAGLVVVFGAWAYYALAGAGHASRQPPLLGAGLLAIGAVYTLRGLGVVPELVQLLRGGATFSLRYVLFSCLSLAIGACYLTGALLRRRERARAAAPPA